MAATEFDAPETDEEVGRGLLQQIAITAFMILMGLMIALDVLRRRRRQRMTNS